MKHLLLAAIIAQLSLATALVLPFDSWPHQRIRLPDVNIHFRYAGSGPPVLLVHGFPQYSVCINYTLIFFISTCTNCPAANLSHHRPHSRAKLYRHNPRPSRLRPIHHPTQQRLYFCYCLLRLESHPRLPQHNFCIHFCARQRMRPLRRPVHLVPIHCQTHRIFRICPPRFRI